ncbi:uncharacterized protein BRPE67_ECDS03530 (plasmid) [Caballeronia cordobensis]|nr:uncharacterized protein BRPE67_ECDS03530 [Burkholderia sp. RPE67]
MIDFITEQGAVALVQRVIFGTRPDHDNSDDRPSAIALQNERLAELLREARVAFEFLCATWPEVFLGQAHAAFARIGVRVRPPDADLMPPSNDAGADCNDEDKDDDVEDDEEGGHA